MSFVLLLAHVALFPAVTSLIQAQPASLDPKPRPVNLPRAGEWQCAETDWTALDVTAEEFVETGLVTKWIGEQLQVP